MFYTNCNYGTAYAVSDDPVKGWKSLGMVLGTGKEAEARALGAGIR